MQLVIILEKERDMHLILFKKQNKRISIYLKYRWINLIRERLVMESLRERIII
jgi:hypothetical protein